MEIEIIPVTHYQQNCSLVFDDERIGVVIDPGGDCSKILARIQELDVRVKYILLTHGHLDHVGGAVQLKTALNDLHSKDFEFAVEILGSHIDDKFWFNALSQQAEKFGFLNANPFTPDRWLEEGEIIQAGSLEFEVLHLPGHTPGHVGFINRTNQVAFTGDVLFAGSIGRADFPRGNYSDLIHSIKTKLFPLGDDLIIISGHGPHTTIGQERHSNPFLC